MDIFPSIDLKDGKCVRLVQGDFDTVHTVAPDPVAVAEDYRGSGAAVIHVVDLDGAKDGERRNAALVAEIVKASHPAAVQLGGGLRSLKDLEEADGLGVSRFVIGSAALDDPGFVKAAVERYGGRVAVGVDAKDGTVRSQGWIGDSGRDEIDFSREMCGLGVGTVIYTDIAFDGLLNGPSLQRLTALREALPGTKLVASGGVTSLADVRALRKIGIDAAVAGKALYTGDLDLKNAFFESRYGHLFDKGSLVPAVIQNAESGEVLMLGYMSPESLDHTMRSGLVTFFSRSKSSLWTKGETSGNYLDLVSITSDCDDDALLIRCRPRGPVCHTGAENCFFKEVTWIR
jgi:phosphoribosylformimino-5-aminoimidazole carboxamide ribotide isomerase